MGDPDHDLNGTFPGSSPASPRDEAGGAEQATPPNTTTRQWRNYWQPAPPAEIDPTTVDKTAARVAIQSIHEMLEANRKPPVIEPVLRDSNGKAVLGSRAMTEDQIARYLQEHPGSSVS